MTNMNPFIPLVSTALVGSLMYGTAKHGKPRMSSSVEMLGDMVRGMNNLNKKVGQFRPAVIKDKIGELK